MKNVDVLIIGAGTSGLTARRQVAKSTDNYLIVDDGRLGTTCARVGCMPSKVLIQTANDYHRRHKLSEMGIHGGESLTVNSKEVMQHVRKLRDRFTSGVFRGMESWQDKLVRKRAQFIDANTIDLEGEKIFAQKIIIASGSRPVVPEAWLPYKEFLVDTNSFFELEDLPASAVVIGLGVIGCELGQAINRLGVKVIGVTRNKRLGGLTDPKIQDYFAEKLSKEFPIHYSGANLVGVSDSGLLKLEADGKTYEVEKAILSLGRRPNIDNLGLEKLNLELNEWGVPIVDPSTMQIKGAEHLFLPGDVNGDRPILHEAADEGKIAGLNASQEVKNYQRRTALGITFCDPNIASVGLGWTSLNESNIKFEVGEVSFEGQGRSIVKLKEQGMLRVYGEKSSGRLLGAEMHGPDAEHIAHLLAWVISLNLNVTEVLRMPFYHPVIEEGLRTALRDLAFKLSDNPEEELLST